MRVTVAGATGLIGARLVRALRERGDEVTALSRDPDRARARLGVEALRWHPQEGPPPAEAIAGRDAVVNLVGAPVARRWTRRRKDEIRESRVAGTRSLVAGLERADPRPRVLVNASAVGYYGDRGDRRVTESDAAADDFLGRVATEWEDAARGAERLGVRVVLLRTGLVLAPEGGLLRRLLLPFKLGVGGPVGSGRQYYPWIHIEDEIGLALAALDDERWSGPVNATAPEPVTSRELARTLGRVLRRPAFLPVPGIGLRAVFGEMGGVLLEGQRAVPARALELGYAFRHPDLEEALRDLLGRER